MGVPKFYSWLRMKNRDFRGILQRSVPGIVSTLALDMNGLLHQVAQKVFSYGDGFDEARIQVLSSSTEEELYTDYFGTLSTAIANLMAKVAPKDYLIIAVDGVAPLAKINQQRTRRFASHGSDYFNPAVISPGTEFMFRVDEFLKGWLAMNEKILPRNTVYSSHMVPGEAEHKIFSFFRDKPLYGVHAINGLDADLVVLSMTVPADIIIVREDITDIVNVSNLKAYLSQRMQSSSSSSGGFVSDFVVLSFLLGNDFLPNTPALEDLPRALETLLDAYTGVGKALVNPTGIDYTVMKEILRRVDEKKLLLGEVARLKNPPLALTRSLTMKNLVSREGTKTVTGVDLKKYSAVWYREALGPRGLEDMARDLLGREAFPVTTERVDMMARDYLVGLGWVFRYYTGEELNMAWSYRYHFAPLLDDMQRANIVDVSPVLPDDSPLTRNFLNVPQGLTSIIPLSSIPVIPPQMIPLAYGPLADEFPVGAVVVEKSTGASWHNIILLPFLDEERLVLVTPAFSPVDIVKYMPQNEVLIVKERGQTYPAKSQAMKSRPRIRGRIIKPDASYPGKRKDWKSKKPLL